MPHLIYLAYGFPPAAKSGSYRMRAMANEFAERGWDVTAVSLAETSWHREHGIDLTLLQGVHPRIRRVGVDVAREDLEPDLRLWSEDRARDPDAWRRTFMEQSQADFPEAIFGAWRRAYEETVEQVFAEHPADLLLASPNPYVTLAVARHLHRLHGVPYVIDFRDAWSLDVVSGEVAFGEDSAAGQIERDVLDHSLETWFVNGPIRDFYAQRYPDTADRFHVVRNGYDPELIAEVSPRDPVEPPLVFGYLGTMSLGLGQLAALLDGWAAAKRTEDPLMAGARLEIRGHMGAGHAAGVSGHAALVASRSLSGVTYGGPVSKAEVTNTYSEWDVLVLALVGGRYVTSGKVYEYLATGLPVVSAHQPEHAATEVLQGNLLWVPTRSLDPEDLAVAFLEGARRAVNATREDRAAAVAHAARYRRDLQIRPAVDRIISHLALSETGAAAPLPPPTAALPRHEPLPPQRVLLLAARPVVATGLRPAVQAFLDAGHEVRVLSRGNVRSSIHQPDVEVRRLKGVEAGRPARLSPAWWRGQWRSRVIGPLAAQMRPSRGVWFQLRSDGVARTWAAQADMVVALDRNAAYSAWRIAQDRPEVQSVLGLTEARLRLL